MSDENQALRKAVEQAVATKISDSSGSASVISKWDPTLLEDETKEDMLAKKPSRPQINVVTVKINSFEQPVFLTEGRMNVYSLIGKTPTKRIPEVESTLMQLHVIADKEIVYALPQYNEEERGWAKTLFYEGESNHYGSVFVICGKKFGTRKLDALASILLKLSPASIILQKYMYNRDTKNTRWVEQYNKKVTELENFVDTYLRKNGD
jgi:hypothetical protein